MKNFQDILHQKNMPYGPLWCDEGIAKEIQLLKRMQFLYVSIQKKLYSHQLENICKTLEQKTYLLKQRYSDLTPSKLL